MTNGYSRLWVPKPEIGRPLSSQITWIKGLAKPSSTPHGARGPGNGVLWVRVGRTGPAHYPSDVPELSRFRVDHKRGKSKCWFHDDYCRGKRVYWYVRLTPLLDKPWQTYLIYLHVWPRSCQSSEECFHWFYSKLPRWFCTCLYTP